MLPLKTVQNTPIFNDTVWITDENGSTIKSTIVETGDYMAWAENAQDQNVIYTLVINEITYKNNTYHYASQ
jgi:hypothetical protein